MRPSKPLASLILVGALLVPAQASAAYRHVKLTTTQAKSVARASFVSTVCAQPGQQCGLVQGRGCSRIKRNVLDCTIIESHQITPFITLARASTMRVRRRQDGGIDGLEIAHALFENSHHTGWEKVKEYTPGELPPPGDLSNDVPHAPAVG